MQALNSLSLCASCENLVRVTSEDETAQALAWAQHRDEKVTLLGAGSNVVLAGDLTGLVVVQASTGITAISEDDDSVVLRVAAGENWHEFVAWCLDKGFYGLENLALIPGTVGAAPIQNIGAYGVEIKTFIRRVDALQINSGQSVELSNEDCKFSYRHSVFKGELRDQLAITSVDFCLPKTSNLQIDYPALAEEITANKESGETAQGVFNAVVKIRSSKLPDPALLPNAGSFFKNPVLPSAVARELTQRYENLPVYPQSDGTLKFPAAWFIDQCGWKGYRKNGVGVHPEHALVLVNYGSNSGREVLQLAGQICRSVKERFAISLEQEPRTYGGSND